MKSTSRQINLNELFIMLLKRRLAGREAYYALYHTTRECVDEYVQYIMQTDAFKRSLYYDDGWCGSAADNFVRVIKFALEEAQRTRALFECTTWCPHWGNDPNKYTEWETKLSYMLTVVDREGIITKIRTIRSKCAHVIDCLPATGWPLDSD